VDSTPIHILYGHDDGITCVDVSSDLDIVVSSSRDGTLNVHSLFRGHYIRSIRPQIENSQGAYPRLTWTGVASCGQIVTYCDTNSTLYLYSINGKYLSEAVVDQKLQAFLFSKVNTLPSCYKY